MNYALDKKIAANGRPP